MAEVIKMPRMSDTMEEGVIVAWHKKVGDKVKSGDLLAEVETDKATMELESYQNGTLLYIGVKAGDAVKVDGILAVIGKEGESYKDLLKENSEVKEEKTEDKKVDKAEEKTKDKPEEKQESSSEKKTDKQESKEKVKEAEATEEKPEKEEAKETETSTDGRLKASPLAKKIASEKGIDLQQVKGSGDEGRIVKRDVESFTPEKSNGKGAASKVILPNVTGKESFEEIAVSQMRKTIARRLGESKFTAPHFYLTMSINMENAVKSRASMNEVSPIKISYNDIIIKAVASALRQHPKVNSSWLGDKIRINHHVHIGVAVAVDEGLLVPVLRFANEKSLSHIAAEVKELAQKAKNKKLQPDEMQGNTFTISNLGMFDIEEFTAIINTPDACILAVGGITDTPIVKDGNVVIAHIMKITLSCDHRVVDGATGSQFLLTLRSLLEDPVRILV